MKLGIATSSLQEDPVSSCFTFEPTPNGKIEAIPISNWSLMLMNSINPELRAIWDNRKDSGEKNFEKLLTKYFKVEIKNFEKAIDSINSQSEGNLYFNIQLDISIIFEVLDQKTNHQYSYIFTKVFRDLIVEVTNKFTAKVVIFVNQFSLDLIRQDHNIDVINRLVSSFSESLQLESDSFYITTLASRDTNGWKYFIDKTIETSELGRVEAFRISIEWAEIFPRKGEFSENAAEKYKEIINYLYSKDISITICTDHMSWPLWLGNGRGWSEKDSIEQHDKYINDLFRYFQNNQILHKISKVLIFNEPYSFLPACYLDGAWPPYISSSPKIYTGIVGILGNYGFGRKFIKLIDRKNPFICAMENTSRAHVSAFRIIKGINDSIAISSSHIHTRLEANPSKSLTARALAFFGGKLRNVWWQITVKKDMRNLVYDFEAIQLYAKMYVNISNPPDSIMQNVISMDLNNAFSNGWIYYPENYLAIVFERTSLFLNLLIDFKVSDQHLLPKLSFTELGGPAGPISNFKRLQQSLEVIKYAQTFIPLELDYGLKWCSSDNFEWTGAYNNLLRFGELNFDFTKKKSAYIALEKLNYSDKWVLNNAKKLLKSLHLYYDFLLEVDGDDLFVEKINKYAAKVEDFININTKK